MKRRDFVKSAIAGAAATAWWPGFSMAQANVARYMVPYPPGGPTDLLGRVIANAWGKYSGKTVVVENKAGAAGGIGIESLLRMPANGSNIGTLPNATLLSSLMGNNLNFDPLTGYTPVCMGYEISLVLVVNPEKLPNVYTLEDLIRTARATPDKLNFTTSSYGSAAHLLAESLQGVGNFDMMNVPYKGAAPALMGLLAGEVEVLFSDLVTPLPQITAGTVRPIAVGAAERVSQLPDVPTLIESGFNFHATSWNAVVAPPNMSVETLETLDNQLKQALNDPETKNSMSAVGATSAYMHHTELRELIAAEYANWQQVIKERNIKVG